MKVTAALALALSLCTSAYAISDTNGCPLEFDGSTTYRARDRVQVNGLVYECRSFPLSRHCSQAGFEPDGVYSNTAWILLGGCEGTVAPTTSPNFSSLQEIDGGCPEMYDSTTVYRAGDLVSLDSLVYECKSVGSEYCNSGSNFAPGSENARLGWTLKGYCDGTASPTQSPICTWYNGTQPITVESWSDANLLSYEAGTRVRKGTTVYKCKSFPFNLWCKIPGYEPEVGEAWKESWENVGECNTTGQFEPTASPTASSSAAPTATPSPSSITPVYDAVFDSNYGVPRCEFASNTCDTGSLVVGRGNMTGGAEPNYPNTLDGCPESNNGVFHVAESIDRIWITSTGGEEFRAGENVTIAVGTYIYDEDDTVDFFYAANASNPIWIYIGSNYIEGYTGPAIFEESYTLPTGADNQAVRVQLTYDLGPSTNPCDNDGNEWFHERDDVVFKVLP